MKLVMGGCDTDESFEDVICIACDSDLTCSNGKICRSSTSCSEPKVCAKPYIC